MMRLLAYILLVVTCTLINSWVNKSWAQSTEPVWIDTDPACDQRFNNDVDDCWALAYALSHPYLQVKGISTTFGNTGSTASYNIAKHILQEFKQRGLAFPESLLYPGAQHAIDDTHSSNPAVEALHLALQKQRLTVIALGPLTNIALLLTHYPEDIRRIQNIISVAGQRDKNQRVFRPNRNTLLHMHDVNFQKDVKAYELILDSTIPITLVPFEVAAQFKLTENDLALLAQSSKLTQWLADRSKRWLEFWQDGFGVNGFYPFDLVAVAYTANPELLLCEPMQLTIIHRRALFRESRSNLVAKPSHTTASNNLYCYSSQHKAKHTIVTKIIKLSTASQCSC